MKIGLDVMGGDYAPQSTIEGAILAQEEISPTDQIVLIGDVEIIKNLLNQHHIGQGVFQIIHAAQVVGMGEKPLKAISLKPES
nr:phosphate--acyl-ACP acyltransferase [Bacteroidota bacterium]